MCLQAFTFQCTASQRLQSLVLYLNAWPLISPGFLLLPFTLRRSKQTTHTLMAGQEAAFHEHIEGSSDLFPETEVPSDNSVFDLVLICGWVLVPPLGGMSFSLLFPVRCFSPRFASACSFKPLSCHVTQSVFQVFSLHNPTSR